MVQQQIEEIKLLLDSPKSIIIVAHKNPDGDAMGSSLGLYHYLKMYNHAVTVIVPNDYPSFLKWLPGNETVCIYDANENKAIEIINQAEIIFTLDFNALHRIGDSFSLHLEQSKAIKIMIDHHQQPEDYADYMYSDVSMSSACEMVYNFLNYLSGLKSINSDIATCLYTGIVTDTGSFRFSSTTTKTHQVVAQLIEKGANNAEIHNNLYNTNSLTRLQLLGRALQNLVVLQQYNTAYIVLSQDDLNEFNYKKGDTEGVVNYALSIKGISFAVIFIENRQEQIIKLSLRSNGSFSVNEFSRTHFNGGGHNNAAGGKSDLTLQQTIDKFISILPAYKEFLKS